jgi:hypothetical protein
MAGDFYGEALAVIPVEVDDVRIFKLWRCRMAVTVSIAVNGSVVRSMPEVPWSSGMNGQNALEQAYAAGTGYSFVLQYFGASLGYEVSFDGVAA